MRILLVLASPGFERKIHVEANASSVAFEAVLMQMKEDCKIRLAQLACKTLTAAKRNSPACECGPLTIIFALRKFGVYLLLKDPFVILTNHIACKSTCAKKDIHGRLS